MWISTVELRWIDIGMNASRQQLFRLIELLLDRVAVVTFITRLQKNSKLAIRDEAKTGVA
jgi:hypothetical protein